jgi:hypothetical protein
MKPTNAFASMAIVAASLAIGYQVYAHCGKCAASARTIAAQLDQNKMTLAKAVTAAEEHSKGRAISVLSDVRDDDQVAVHVFCLSGDKIQKCHVDHKTGRVTEMKEVKEFPISSSVHDHDDKHSNVGGAGDSGGGAALTVTNRTAEVGCGMCMYKMAGVDGCHLAVMLDGKPYLVNGATWPNHDYCDRKIPAVVTGKLDNGTFIATSVTEKK